MQIVYMQILDSGLSGLTCVPATTEGARRQSDTGRERVERGRGRLVLWFARRFLWENHEPM